jgi:HEAT repeat protein
MSQATAQTKPQPQPQAEKPKPPAIPPEFQADAIMKMTLADALALLQRSDATEFQKAKVCMRLAVVGDRSAVAPLAALLSDEKLSQYARFGLVPISDPAVDNAFREALPKLTGTLRIGLIDSIGQRKDSRAVDPLTRLLYGGTPDESVAAAAALGLISGRSATEVLTEALMKTKDPVRREVAAACLVCAEGWLDRGDRQQAMALYERLVQADIPKPIRLGAMQTIVAMETHPGRPR